MTSRKRRARRFPWGETEGIATAEPGAANFASHVPNPLGLATAMYLNVPSGVNPVFSTISKLIRDDGGDRKTVASVSRQRIGATRA
jgi:hypothetical protein